MHKLNIVPPTEKERQPLLRPPSLANRHLISLHDLTPSEVEYLLNLARCSQGKPCGLQEHVGGQGAGDDF